MTFLIVNYEYPPTGAGAAQQNFYLAHELVRRGHQVVVLTAAFEHLRGLTDENGVWVWRIRALRRKKNQSNMIEMASYVFSALFYMGKAIRHFQVDKVLVFFSFPCGPLGLWAKYFFSKPFLVYLQGSDIPGNDPALDAFHAFLSPLRRMIYRQSLAVVANSPAATAMASRADSFPVKYIPNGIDTHFFRPMKTDDKRGFVFLFVGRLHHEKNVKFLLKAFIRNKSHFSNAVLRIVGQGYEEEELRNLIEQYHAHDFVELLPWQEKAELPALYNGADCFINPSLNEGMPNAVMEAMACGLPVVVSNVAGNKDLVIEGVNGLLFDLGNEAQLINRLDRIYKDADLRWRLSMAARQSMVEGFSVESMTQQFLELLVD